MKRRALIVNADGYGFTYGNNEGIRRCLQAGFVRSVSINANFPAAEEAGFLRDWPGVSAGIHFNLSVGRPVSNPDRVPHLVNREGSFLGAGLGRRLVLGKIPPREIEIELAAQAERLAGMGLRLSHWDGHQNRHLIPQFFRVACAVATRYEIPCLRSTNRFLFTLLDRPAARRAWHLATHPLRAARYATAAALGLYARRQGFRIADRLLCPGVLDAAWKDQREFWLALLERLPGGVSEIYCHPGIPDETLRANATYVEGREREMRVLSLAELADGAKTAGVEMISFWEM